MDIKPINILKDNENNIKYLIMDYIIFIIKIFKIVLKNELFICHLNIVNI